MVISVIIRNFAHHMKKILLLTTILLAIVSTGNAQEHETPNAKQAKAMFMDVYNKVFGNQGATLHYKVITLAEGIVENIDRKEAWAEDTTDPKLLRIDHIRRGEVAGIHTVRYDSEADIITITHDAHSRQGFELGAVLAAEYTKDHQGLLTISDMFKF